MNLKDINVYTYIIYQIFIYIDQHYHPEPMSNITLISDPYTGCFPNLGTQLPAKCSSDRPCEVTKEEFMLPRSIGVLQLRGRSHRGWPWRMDTLPAHRLSTKCICRQILNLKAEGANLSAMLAVLHMKREPSEQRPKLGHASLDGHGDGGIP